MPSKNFLISFLLTRQDWWINAAACVCVGWCGCVWVGGRGGRVLTTKVHNSMNKTCFQIDLGMRPNAHPFSYFTTNPHQLWTGNILSPAPTWLWDQLKVISFYLDLILGSSGGACNPLSHPYSPGILLPKEVPDLYHRVSLTHTHVDGKVGIYSTHLVLKSLRKDNYIKHAGVSST